MDLFICLYRQAPVKFLPGYNRLDNEHALQWQQQKDFAHWRVDAGECPDNGYKQSSLLLPCQQHFQPFDIARRFLRYSEDMDASLADFIYARILEYPAFIRAAAQTRPDRDTPQENY